jgi:hypothetical protein
MRTVFATLATICVSLLLLALGQRIIFEFWANVVWDPVDPENSLVFDEIVLYTLFPAVIVVAGLMAAMLAKRRHYAVALVGASPVWLSTVLLRWDPTCIPYIVAYVGLSLVAVTLTRISRGPT